MLLSQGIHPFSNVTVTPFVQGIREGIAELFWGTLRKALGKIAGENGSFLLKGQTQLNHPPPCLASKY